MDASSINFNVLRRHDPHITSILDSTSYAVIYRYFHGAWSKTGFEGTMFIFRRDNHPFNAVFVLNRQGLDNLCEGLLPGWNVDLDEGLIIWRNAGATGDADDDVIYGIWVYEEKDRTRIATTMQELVNFASTQQDSNQIAPSPPAVSLSHPIPRVPIISAGQTISLDQLFGVASVCSEPPPKTSALPHPGNSVIDSIESSDQFLPNKILSPDASDLPKGMELLDSLFQKASIKSQNSHETSSPNFQPINPHLAPSIQQFIDQTTTKASSQNSPSKSTPTIPRKDRNQSSNVEESYKLLSTGLPQAIHLNNRSSRPEYRSMNHSNNNSRRSSGGSSSRSRNDHPPVAPNPNPQNHQQAQLLAHFNSSNPVDLVAAPVPVENLNDEARHNILSLIGHPAATRRDHVYSSQASQHSSPIRINSSTQADAAESSRQDTMNDPRRAFQSEQRFHSSAGPLIHPNNDSHTGSQTASQRPSPNSKVRQASTQHSATTPSLGNFGHPSPPRNTHKQSNNHSPNGPRPQKNSAHHHAENHPSGLPSLTQNFESNVAQVAGLVFSNSVWPFNKHTPDRDSSPSNPGRQSSSKLNNPAKRPATDLVNDRESSNNNHSHHHHQKLPPSSPSQPRYPLDPSPPEIYDSSRPIKPDSYAVNNAAVFNPNKNGMPIALQPEPAVESPEGSCSPINKSIQSSNVVHSIQSHAPPLDKSQFVNGIHSLINNNGPFVDTLYARYLARYAEKHL